MKRISALAIVCVAQFGCATVLSGTSDKIYFYPAAVGMQVSEDGKKLDLTLTEYHLRPLERVRVELYRLCLSKGRTQTDCVESSRSISAWMATIDGRRSHRFDIDVGDHRWHEQFDSKFNPWWLLGDLFIPLFIGFAVDGVSGQPHGVSLALSEVESEGV